MKRLMRARHLVEASHVVNLLQSAGIDAFLRNENLVRVAGEVPFDQCWPEVWLGDAQDEARARNLLRELASAPRLPAWTCPRCDEWLEGQFTACWSCGTQRPLP